jgi:nitrogen fixation/metabolism regulation signal transduction histidine kinase
MPEVREALACIVRDADRGKDIVDRIRAHIKKAPPRNDRFDINEAIQEVNAIEAMGSVEERARTLSIRTEQRGAEGILVAVHDSGPGVDPEHLERVFDPFYTTKNSGLGMGLSICRSIVDAHGGRLWAEASEARGAVFQFTLPAAHEEL